MPRRFVMEFERPLVELEAKLAELQRMDLSGNPELVVEVSALAEEVERLRIDTYLHLGPWERVQIARHPERPKTDEYVNELFTDVVELHGDRTFSDDEAIFAALATRNGRRVAVVGHRKGTDTKSNVRRNFGSPHPEGFRKAMRVIKLAEKFGLPVISFLDTAGAFPGIEAEERGQAWAIAESLALVSAVRVPFIAIGIGEGGSGGALAIGFGDRVFMLENSYYSVISPEACASILYRDSSQAANAASCLRMTAGDLQDLGLVDRIIGEPLGGAHADAQPVIEAVGRAIDEGLAELTGIDPAELVEQRYERLRSIGEWSSSDEG